VRIATYNIEWFTKLFDKNDKLLRDDKWSSRRDITRKQQSESIAEVLRAIDADCIMVVEAPNSSAQSSTLRALENFARHYKLRQKSVLTGFVSDTQQEIALMYDPKLAIAKHDPSSGLNSPPFDSSYFMDTNIDAEPEEHFFSKPPLEIEFKTKLGRTLRLIGVHIKSKAPYGAKNAKDEIRISIENRRKQLAQSHWIRSRVDMHLKNKDSLVILGDFNDGPGLDEYEELFGLSSVEIVLGEALSPSLRLSDPHADAWINSKRSWMPASARFFDRKNDRYKNLLLDFVMVSSDLTAHSKPDWKIWHPFDDAECFKNEKLRTALLTASDHFPVTLDLEV